MLESTRSRGEIQHIADFESLNRVDLISILILLKAECDFAGVVRSNRMDLWRLVGNYPKDSVVKTIT
jgi:hypothetical protein